MFCFSTVKPVAVSKLQEKISVLSDEIQIIPVA